MTKPVSDPPIDPTTPLEDAMLAELAVNRALDRVDPQG